MKKEILIPSLGESISEVDILEWKIKSGDLVATDDLLTELETEKATLDLRAPVDGVISLKFDSGSTVKIGEIVAVIDDSASLKEKKTSDKSIIDSKKKNNKNDINPTNNLDNTLNHLKNNTVVKHASPASRKMILDKGLTLENITPSGRGGRVTKEDVIKYLNSTEPQKKSSTGFPLPELSNDKLNLSTKRLEKRTKITRIRKTIANRLVQSQQTAALLTTFNEVDMTSVILIRKQYKDFFKKKYEVSLGFMSFFVKATCQALDNFTLLNSKFEEDVIVTPQYVDIGVAVSTSKGLVVPVIKDAQKKTFDQIERVILDFAIRGREGNLSIEEMTGGTFTITNGGTFGSMLSTPIVNYPQSGILGLHNIVERAIVVKGEIVIRPIMYIALTYDHRLIDGSEAVRFLYQIKELIEDPTRLLIKI